MNLSPAWVPVLAQAGHDARHWAQLGPHDAPDHVIMAWALSHDFVVLTHDLDFGAILAATAAAAPSVVQLRGVEPTPSHFGNLVVRVLAQHGEALRLGALVSIDQDQARIRLLPLRRAIG